MESLESIKSAYRKALEGKKKNLEYELKQVMKELAVLGDGPVKRERLVISRTSPAANPSNETIFPIIEGFLSKFGPARAPDILKAVEKAGYSFGGNKPAHALHSRLIADKTKQFIFDHKLRGFVLNPTPDQKKTIHVGG